MILLPNDTVFFDANEYTLTKDGVVLVQLQAESIVIGNVTDITIEGHCDPEEGTREICLALGERRALAVRDYLFNYLVRSFSYNKLYATVVSHGKGMPWLPSPNERNQRTVTQVIG